MRRASRGVGIGIGIGIGVGVGVGVGVGSARERARAGWRGGWNGAGGDGVVSSYGTCRPDTRRSRGRKDYGETEQPTPGSTTPAPERAAA